MDTVEVWAPIKGYEDAYEVSSLGRVRSLPGKSSKQGKILKQGASGRGYLSVGLCQNAKARTTYIHHLVAAAFIGPRPEGLDICHNNGDFTDNRVANLRYDTRHGNMRDAVEQGTHQSVSKTHCIHGHEMTEENTYIERRMSADGNGVKTRHRCRKCNRKTDTRRNRQLGPKTLEVLQFLAS